MHVLPLALGLRLLQLGERVLGDDGDPQRGDGDGLRVHAPAEHTQRRGRMSVRAPRHPNNTLERKGRGGEEGGGSGPRAQDTRRAPPGWSSYGGRSRYYPTPNHQT